LRHLKEFLKIKPKIVDASLLKGLQIGRNKNSSNENTNKPSSPFDNFVIS
jgi:hypothetical protein